MTLDKITGALDYTQGASQLNEKETFSEVGGQFLASLNICA